MLDFYRTRGGKTFIEGTVPRLINAISRLAEAIERATNDTQEMVTVDDLEDLLQAMREMETDSPGSMRFTSDVKTMDDAYAAGGHDLIEMVRGLIAGRRDGQVR